MERQIIRISVRNLVEFILRSGDIDNRIAASDKDAMQMGAKIHRKIQRQMGANYHSEVTLKCLVECDDFDIQVEGRADGIFDQDECVYIDEIKGILKEVDSLEDEKKSSRKIIIMLIILIIIGLVYIIFKDEDGRRTLDLRKAIESTLVKAGVSTENIYYVDLSTFSEEDLLHSYRREGEEVGANSAISSMMLPGEYVADEDEEAK